MREIANLEKFIFSKFAISLIQTE